MVATVTTHIGKYTASFDGAVQRTLADKLDDIASVKDFGVVGDGVTNDAVAFRSIVGNAGKYYVPAGRYLVTLDIDYSDMLEFTSDVSLIMHPDAVIEYTTAGVPLFVLFECENTFISGGVLEFAGEFQHNAGTGALELLDATNVNSLQSAYKSALGIVEPWNISDNFQCAAISIAGGSNILVGGVRFRGKTVVNQQLADIIIAPNADYSSADSISISECVFDDFTMGIILERGVKKLKIVGCHFGRYAEIGQSPGHAVYVSTNDTSPTAEDIAIIDFVDDGAFVGGQLSPARPDRTTNSIKIINAKNVLASNVKSNRPGGVYDILGVEGGLFKNTLAAPNALQPDGASIVRISNPGTTLDNNGVTMDGLRIRLETLNANAAIINTQGSGDSKDIHIKAFIFIDDATTKTTIFNCGIGEGSYDLTFVSVIAPYGIFDASVIIQAECNFVKGRILTDHEPRILTSAGNNVETEVNGNPAIVPTTADPNYPQPGQIRRADRVTWDPLSKGSGGSYLVMRNDANDGWVSIDGQG